MAPQCGHAQCHRQILRRVFLSRSPRRWASTAWHAFMKAFGYGSIDRHRYSRRKTGALRVARVEAACVQAEGRPGMVSGRDHQHGHRPGPDQRDSPATGAFCRRNRRARQDRRGSAPGRRRLARPGSNVVIPRKPQLMKPVDIATDEQWDVVFDGMEGAVGPSGTAHGHVRCKVQVGREDRHGSSFHRQTNREHQACGNR